MLKPERMPFPLPQIHDAFDALSGSKYYKTVDLLSGFWQTPMEESCKQYTASLWGCWNSPSVTACPLGSATLQQLSSG